MALDGGKLICFNKDEVSSASQTNIIIPARGKTFKFGYYTDCDVVLDHPDALGLHCTIDCDAFGRVTIENRCPEYPIKLDGKVVNKTRPLLHNTEICILDKHYRWQFERKHQPMGFKMEDIIYFTTPSKSINQAEQAPNSEPTRKWQNPFYKRLTIHSFAYCIKAGESAQDVEITRDENKPLNVYDDTNEPKLIRAIAKRRSSTSSLPSDLIDLKTPKVRRPSYPLQKTPLSVCKLSETVITSYSPRETGVRPEKSFAEVRSPAAIPSKSLAFPDVSIGPFLYLPSPLTKNNPRPSMHLIDLTTPTKLVPSQASPSRTLLKSTLKKNLPKVLPPQQQSVSTPEKVATSSDSSVYSIHSTDEESVIELSDEGSLSPSPVLKTPPRSRTPGSLMKRAILSSAKKAAIAKRFEQSAPAPPPTPITPKTNVRFLSQSTPHRKSLSRLHSSREGLMASHSSAGPGKSMVTSTPFRRDGSVCKAARRSSISGSSSTSLHCLKSSSRTSLMLKQALSKKSQTQSAEALKSIAFFGPIKSPRSPLTKARKSVSFLDRIEYEGPKAEGEDLREVGNAVETITNSRKDATFSPEKEKYPNDPTDQKEDKCAESLPDVQKKSTSAKQLNSSFSPEKTENSFVPETPAARKDAIRSLSRAVSIETDERLASQLKLNVTFSPESDKEDCIVQAQVNLTATQIEPDAKVPRLIIEKTNETAESKNKNLGLDYLSSPQTPQSTKSRPKHIKSNQLDSDENLHPIEDVFEDGDFEGLDTIFKTPKARNLMILSSPQSVVLQKSTNDSVELMHSTEFDLSSNLDDIFKTPQSELLTNQVEVPTSSKDIGKTEQFSPEEAFDMLVGRPINKKTYSRKPATQKQELSPLKVPKDPTFPKTDIEEWIENISESNTFSEAQEEDEMSFLTATQGDLSVDPLTMSTLRSGSVNTTNKKKPHMSPVEEAAITMIDDEGEDKMEGTLKDPLEMTATSLKAEDKSVAPKRSISPNISGIDLLDHTSDSLFSETLAVSDDSSPKETDKMIGLTEADPDATLSQTCSGAATSSGKAREEMEIAFENFEERGFLVGNRLVSTPEPKKKGVKDDTRRTMGNQSTPDLCFDLKKLKEEKGMELTLKNFEEHLSAAAKLDQNAKEILEHKEKKKFFCANVETSSERDFEKELALLEDEDDQISKSLKTCSNGHETTSHIGSGPEAELDEKLYQVEEEMKLIFESFDEEPELAEERAAKTPELKKSSLEDHKFDLKVANEQKEMENTFENFEEEAEFTQVIPVKTLELIKSSLKDNQRTIGSSSINELNLQVAKEERETVFKNFREESELSQDRAVKTTEPKKSSLKDHRRTVEGSSMSEVKLDLQAAKEQREMELAFENFEEEPEFSQERSVKTPEPKKSSLKDHRRTVGSSLVSEVKLDLQAAKEQRELELAFENFEEEPEFSQDRDVKTPEPKKSSHKDHRRTMGSSLESEVKLDLQAAKEQRELELAFENFEKEPEFTQERAVQTPEPKKSSLKDHRRTVGSSLVSEVKLDLQVAKEQREMELAFENFEEEPEFSQERAVKTPEPKKSSHKDHRRTMGSSLVSEVKLDLQAAKEQRELELAFENFEKEPEFTQKRAVQTPEPKKNSLKDHRRTVGSCLVSEVKLDLQVAKEQREMELAFENFEEEPEFSQERAVKTPEPKKSSHKDHRRTMGSSLVSEVKLDLQAAKEQRELELAFENFEEEPEFSQNRAVKTPEPKKSSHKGHRRTMGSSLVSEVKLDLQAAKEQRELELAFENFEEEPEFSRERAVKTPEPKKSSLKDYRRTMGSNLVSEVKLDLQAAKEQREMELAFENFKEEPEFSQERAVKTPEPKKSSLKDHRRTVGSRLVGEVKLDLQVAKEQREMELAFENFEEEPEFSQERAVKTPEPKKSSLKDHRRTMGSSLVSEVKLDLQAAKEQREIELAFENFEEEPEFSQGRAVKTPEPKKSSLKDHRRTMGSSSVSDVKLDLQAAKEQRELELAFENFEEEPEFSRERAVKTPEPKKSSLKDYRRTMGSNLVSEVKLDLQAAKEQREMELAFENFEEEPEFSQERAVKTPEPKKSSLKDYRRTMGSNLVSEVKLDLQAAKEQREMELAFENFKEEPEFSQERAVKTPEPEKSSLKDHRRTVGSSLVSDVKLDLQVAKEQREMELAFENFEEEPEFSQERAVKTPESKKSSFKDHRRTMGSSLVSEVKLDFQAAKEQRELELAFENFEEEPEFSQERAVKTPEPKKSSLKDHRRTMGSSLVSDVKLDLQAAKKQREMEMAFENFKEEPEFSQERAVKTPEPKKSSLKDHRRTVGSSLVSEVKLDLQMAKEQREMELAFENFEEEPEFSHERAVKTPESKKISLKDHRRTMGSNLVSEVKLDLQAAKDQRELELAFENFEEKPKFTQERAVQTPEPKKSSLKDHRRTMGSSLVSEVKLDLHAAKEQRELELAFENFEEEPECTQERAVHTPEPKKSPLKDRRRTMGSSSVSEVKLDHEAAKEQRELELASEHFEKEPELGLIRVVQTPAQKKDPNKTLRLSLGYRRVVDESFDPHALKSKLEDEEKEKEIKSKKDDVAKISLRKKLEDIIEKSNEAEEVIEENKLKNEASVDELQIEAVSPNSLKKETQSQISSEEAPNTKARTRARRHNSADVQVKPKNPSRRTTQDRKPEFHGEDENKIKGGKSRENISLVIESVETNNQVVKKSIDYVFAPTNSKDELLKIPFQHDDSDKVTTKNKLINKLHDNQALVEVIPSNSLKIEEAPNKRARTRRQNSTDVQPKEKISSKCLTAPEKVAELEIPDEQPRRTTVTDDLSSPAENQSKPKTRHSTVDCEEKSKEKEVSPPDPSSISVANVSDKEDENISLATGSEPIVQIVKRNTYEYLTDEMKTLKASQDANDELLKITSQKETYHPITENEELGENKFAPVEAVPCILLDKETQSQTGTEDEASNKRTRTRTRRQNSADLKPKEKSQSNRTTFPDKSSKLEVLEEHETKPKGVKSPCKVEERIYTTIKDDSTSTADKKSKPAASSRNVDRKGELKQELPLADPSLNDKGENICLNVESAETNINVVKRGDVFSDENKTLKASENANNTVDTMLSQQKITALSVDKDETEAGKVTEKNKLENEFHGNDVPVSSKLLREEEAPNKGTTTTRRPNSADVQSKEKNPDKSTTVPGKNVKLGINGENENKTKGGKSLSKGEERAHTTLNDSVDREEESKQEGSLVDLSSILVLTKSDKADENISLIIESAETNITTMKVSENKNDELLKIPCKLKPNPSVVESDSDEVILSTPAPRSTRGRRPARKVESTERLAPVTRRGRRGSGQEESEIVSKTPIPSKTRWRAAVPKVEPGESAEEADIEEVVTSSPEPIKMRGRRAALARQSTRTISESSSPIRKTNRRGAVCDVKEFVPETEATEIDDNGGSSNQETVVKNAVLIVEELHVEEVLPSPVTAKTRGRKPATSKKLVETVTESCTPEVQQPTQTSSKARKRRAATKEEATQSITENIALDKKRIGKADAEPTNEEFIPSPPVVRKEELAKVSVKEDIEEIANDISASARKGEPDDSIKQVAENNYANVALPISKTRGRPRRLKEELRVSTTESSLVVRKRGRNLAAEKDHEDHKDADAVTKLLPVKRNRCPSVTSSDQTEFITETSAQKVLLKRKQRGASQKLDADIVIEDQDSETKEAEQSRKRGRLADVKSEKQESATESSTPVRRVRPRKVGMTNTATDIVAPKIMENVTAVVIEHERTPKTPAKISESSEEEVASSPVPSKTRGRAARVLSSHHPTEISVSARNKAQGKIEQKESDHNEVAVPTSKTRARRAANKSETVKSESSSSLPSRGRRGAVKTAPVVHDDEREIEKPVEETSVNTSRGEVSGHDTEIPTEDPEVPETQTRVVPLNSKSKLQSENASPIRKRVRRGAASKDVEVKEDTEKVIPSKKNKAHTVLEPLSESSTNTVEKESDEHDDEVHSQNTATPKRLGRPPGMKLKSMGSAASNPSPVRRRGRTGAQVETVEELKKIETKVSDVEEVFLPAEIPTGSRRRGLTQKDKYIAESSATAEESMKSINKISLNKGRLEKSTEESTDFTPVKEASIPIRTRRASVKETPSTPQANLDVKPLRKRGRPATSKKDATEQSTSSPVDKQHTPAGKSKTTRGKKIVVVEEISSENDSVRVEEKTHKKRNSAEACLPSKDVVDLKSVADQPKAKSTRGKRGQQPKADAQLVSEESHDSPPPKKPTRGRKAQPGKVSKTSEDEQSQPEAQQKPTRLRKAQDQIVNEELTASGRKRRKPQILLSGEFVQ